MGRIAGQSTDLTTDAIIYVGANMSQLEALLKTDARTLKAKMVGISPVGTRSGTPIYSVADVARKMGKLTAKQVDMAMARLNHKDLPKELTKEYWAGKRSKQIFELQEGDLWPTNKVIEHVSEMVKSIKMEIDLLIDGVERQSELTDRQREIMRGLIDGVKMNMLTALHEKFAGSIEPRGSNRKLTEDEKARMDEDAALVVAAMDDEVEEDDDDEL